MNKQETNIAGVHILKPDVLQDNRGYFCELFRGNYIQGNRSFSVKNALRGMHYQKGPSGQSKLVRCIQGEVYDVVIDIRRDSPTFLERYEVVLNSNIISYLYVPKGCLHGFFALQDSIVEYLVDAPYDPPSAAGFDAFSFNIWWPAEEVVIRSEADKQLPSFDEKLL